MRASDPRSAAWGLRDLAADDPGRLGEYAGVLARQPIEVRPVGKNRVRVAGIDRGAMNCFGIRVPGWEGHNDFVVISVFEWPARLQAACDHGDTGECLTLAYYYLYGFEAGTTLHPHVVLKAAPATTSSPART